MFQLIFYDKADGDVKSVSIKTNKVSQEQPKTENGGQSQTTRDKAPRNYKSKVWTHFGFLQTSRKGRARYDQSCMQYW